MTDKINKLPVIKRDPGLVGLSMDRLADQLRDGWRQSNRIKLPTAYRSVSNVAVCGMGGSGLGADILRSVFLPTMSVPVAIINDYHLPNWVNRRTLAIISSYSGTTEEALSALKIARARRSAIVIVTTGGKLAKLAKQYKYPLYEINPSENPSSQPRLGVAYIFMAILAIWRSLKLIKTSPAEIDALHTIAWEACKRYRPTRPIDRNQAKQLALSWRSGIPLLIGAEWTGGNLHTWANQINENAKTFVGWYLLPELDHHLLEGLRNRSITKNIKALIVRDQQYYSRNLKRLDLTAKIIKKLGGQVDYYQPRGATPLEKAVDLLAFGGYASWYLAAVRKVNPAPVPTVDALKAELSKR